MRGKKRSLVENREWLEAYEEGKSLEQIAKRSGRATSTVWKGIQQARQEREARVVREGLLREAYQQHYADLLEAARFIQKAAEMPDRHGLWSAPTMDRRIQMLVDGLKEHIPDSPLWRARRDWDNLARQFLEDIAPQVRARLGNSVDNTLSQSAYANREGFIESLWSAVEMVATGASLEHMQYSLEKTAERPVLRWGAYGLSLPLPDDQKHSDRLKEQHEQLLREATAQERVCKVRDVLISWAKARESIQQEVEVLLLRHVVPGRCKLCPQ